MAHRRIGQERLGLTASRAHGSSLDELSGLIDWRPITVLLNPIHASAKGEAAWPPLAMFKALLLSVWYDLSDVKLGEALDDRASFRRFCGFSGTEPVPERTAFVRFRKALVAAGLDRTLFEVVTAQLKAKAVRAKRSPTPPSSRPPAKAMMTPAGSSIRASRPFTVSRRMSGPTPIPS